MLLAAVVAACLACCAVASTATVPLPEKILYRLEDAEKLFKQHVKQYQRKYDGEEYNKRLEIFKLNLKKINEKNSLYPRTVFGVTSETDLTLDEIRKTWGFNLSNLRTEDYEEVLMPEDWKSAPETYDWRQLGVVTSVKNQGGCGSCYIFSAIGNIEGQYAFKHGQFSQAFSEQQCLDCLDNDGCGGGIPHEVMNSLAKKAGCMKEEDYKYIGIDHQPCKEDAGKVVAKVTGSQVLNKNISNAEDLKQWLFNVGPLSIALDPTDFADYKGGVLHPHHCSSDEQHITHAVLLVGYGEEGGEKYWIIKDSYGEGVRENGYVRLLRGVNACGAEKSYIATSFVQ